MAFKLSRPASCNVMPQQNQRDHCLQGTSVIQSWLQQECRAQDLQMPLRLSW